MASPRELMVYGTLITNFFGRDRSRRFIGLNARGMVFTGRKGKIKGHYGNVTEACTTRTTTQRYSGLLQRILGIATQRRPFSD